MRWIQPFVLLLFFLLSLIICTTLASEELIFEKLFAEDLTTANYDTLLSSRLKTGFGDSSSSEYNYVVIDFYVTWCGTCQRFAPEYERVAEHFNMQDIPVWALRVNCGEEGELCKKFKINGFPTVKWGERADFLRFIQGEGDDSALITIVTAFRTAEDTVDWIYRKLSLEYRLKSPEQYEEARLKMLRDRQGDRGGSSKIKGSIELDEGSTFTDAKASMWDAEKSVFLMIDYIFETQVLDEQKREVFFNFMDMLCNHFPTKSCRPSLCYFSAKMKQMWLPDAESIDLDIVRNIWRLCGKDIAHYRDGVWQACKGSSPELRGFPCGLWLLFHSIMVQFPDSMSDNDVVDNLLHIRNFIGTFFSCTDCREHFLDMSKNVAKEVGTKKEAVLWFWKSHNKVNKRLRETGGSFDDPKFPKIQWPSSELCRQCRVVNTGESTTGVVAWDEDAVYEFLLSYYRGDSEEGGGGDHKKHKKMGDELEGDDAGYLGMKVMLCLLLVPVGAAGWLYYRFGFSGGRSATRPYWKVL